ncbi:MAG: hypothetical protein IKO22_06960 [Oscillospiraceae bacterium]|nr:hypothetical protein [Oscillospiraceae bacterium]
MKKLLAGILMAAMLLSLAAFSVAGAQTAEAADEAEEDPLSEIAAIYFAGAAQPISREDGSEDPADTVIYLYQDGSYRQYVMVEGAAGLYGEGEYSIDGSFTEKGSVLTLRRDKKSAEGIAAGDKDSSHEYVIGEPGFIRIYPEPVIGQEVSIPEEYADELIVKTGEDDLLVSVYEKASVEAAAAEGMEDAESAGWLFSIGKVTAEELHAMLCQDMSGREVIAKDVEGNFYICYHPTDVQLVREDGGYTEEVLAHWGELNEWAASARTAFVNNNDGLLPVTYDNSDPAMALSRAAWEDGASYEIRTLEYAQHGSLAPAGVDAAPYVERLIRNAKYEYVDTEEAPDGEYIVLAFPEEDLRYDFFLGGDYVRRTDDDGSIEQLYRVTLAGGDSPSAVLREWAKDLAAANGLS